MNEMLEAALEYSGRGISVIPIPPGAKIPGISWKQFQETRADENQIRAWWQRWPNSNIGIVTGAISNLVVLDCDAAEGLEIIEQNGGLPVTAVALTSFDETGFRKRHYYFQHPGERLKNFVKKLPGLDFRGDSGYVLAPPSLHPSGARYEWAQGEI